MQDEEVPGLGLCSAPDRTNPTLCRPTPRERGPAAPPGLSAPPPWPAEGIECVSVGGIAGGKWASRRAIWETAGLARPPTPAGATRAKGLGKHPVGTEYFDAGAGPRVGIVKRFAGGVPLGVGDHSPCHGALTRPLWSARPEPSSAGSRPRPAPCCMP
jgi:hypothetical protein